MIPALNQDMVDGMDDTAGLLPGHLPASRNSAFFWRDQPSVLASQFPAPKRKPTSKPAHITLTGREQGLRDADRNFALRMGSIG
ncbi:hypothetical protein [Variovorax sp. PMC12]|uniref:hypothetical protein n=1 Tax=Variovorax sp. PMC12 TaxID=2126319 RepID=UPI000D1219BF|nr:hypothetical protein [Variovorax sp. PMC12]AVQ81682.1 hypothetical protein C4F17_12380 [Variovorax sp. PMC12]